MISLLSQIDQQQQRINTYRPFEEPQLSQLKDYFKIGLTYASNALEGNSLTESETKVVLEDGLTIGGKSLKDHYEAVGHAKAFGQIFELFQKTQLDENDIKGLHRLFYEQIDAQEAGAYRKIQVYLSASKHNLPNPEHVPALMTQFVGRQGEWKKAVHPVVFAARFHKAFVQIHPFIDGNGRVARLLMNLALLQAGYTLVIVPPILRAEYIQVLEQAWENDEPFIDFITRCVIETQKDYLRLLEESPTPE